MATPIIRRVSSPELQAIFNEHYALRLLAGEFRESLEWRGHPSPLKSGQPICTESQYLEYSEPDGTLRIKGHRYKSPDGIITTRNGLDPKWILHGGFIYAQGRVSS